MPAMTAAFLAMSSTAVMRYSNAAKFNSQMPKRATL